MSGSGNGMAESLARWAAKNPKVRRVWMAQDRRKPKVDVTIELEPVADSEESIAVWMAHADEWRAELREDVSPAIDVSWVDPNGAARRLPDVLDEAKVLVYDRSA
jgi:hypothetical protein